MWCALLRIICDTCVLKSCNIYHLCYYSLVVTAEKMSGAAMYELVSR